MTIDTPAIINPGGKGVRSAHGFLTPFHAGYQFFLSGFDSSFNSPGCRKISFQILPWFITWYHALGYSILSGRDMMQYVSTHQHKAKSRLDPLSYE
jgi:hypothetical protein